MQGLVRPSIAMRDGDKIDEMEYVLPVSLENDCKNPRKMLSMSKTMAAKRRNILPDHEP